jgi:hypothetical protein
MSFGSDLEREREQVGRLVRHASANWAEAMRAHMLAPPDSGFAGRLRGLAEAAATEQIAWEHAHQLGLGWRPIPDAASSAPPYELRPGTGRRGPEDLWIRFDAAVRELNIAISGSDAAAVATAFGGVAETAADLAEAVAREDEAAREARARALPRNAAA